VAAGAAACFAASVGARRGCSLINSWLFMLIYANKSENTAARA
jgi:hypothetical protein